MIKKKKSIVAAVIICFIILLNTTTFGANNIASLIKKVEYTEDFKKWLELPEEERKNVIQPRMYDIESNNIASKNPFYRFKLLGTSIKTKYNLKDDIPTNLVIRDQMSTNTCWTFAGLSSLETNLALTNKKNKTNISKVYDFSERHMEYATSKTFADNKTNEKGYNRELDSGGNWLIAETYLTNGMGAINEAEMPFKNEKEKIDISQIQNKTVTSKVSDTVWFADYNSSKNSANKEQIINQIKEHIQNYGSIFASLHGNSSSASGFTCYNNDTGAKYCATESEHLPDHAVSIVGWDDDYSIDNFAENAKPTHKGAWIIRNSWGEKIEYNVKELKEQIFQANEAECKKRGWNSAEAIPDEFLKTMGLTIEGEKAYQKVGDNGFMYVSYEDCNISKTLYGIEKAADTVDYENIYQYDEFFPAYNIGLRTSSAMVCNVFDKKTEGKEYLTEVSIYAPENYTCKVYVNAEGEEKSESKLKLVQLKNGETENIAIGYHTLEFAKPIQITGKKFVVAVEMQSQNSNEINVSLESKIDQIPLLNSTKVEKNKCFLGLKNNSNIYEWVDLGQLSTANTSLLNGDSSIKAFTTSEYYGEELESIQIVTPPTKTEYVEGENFNSEGMVVQANYNSKTKPTEILESGSYTITNGNDLKVGQESVTITYEGKSATQKITVKENPNKKIEKAVNSNFEKVKCDVKKVQAYIFTNQIENSYVLVDLDINDIERNLKNDSLEYYYYVSANANEENIKDWIKITEEQKEVDKISFIIDSRNVKNISELYLEDNIYLYIKEVAKKGEDTSILISKSMKLEADGKIETHIDNPKKEEPQETNPTNPTPTESTQNPVSEKDQTTANGSIPQTGSRVTLLILFTSFVIIGTFGFIKYRKLNKEIK